MLLRLVYLPSFYQNKEAVLEIQKDIKTQKRTEMRVIEYEVIENSQGLLCKRLSESRAKFGGPCCITERV